jgi:hypothetical protein
VVFLFEYWRDFSVFCPGSYMYFGFLSEVYFQECFRCMSRCWLSTGVKWYICWFSRHFLLCRYLISSLILMLGILCCVYLWAGEVLGTFILAQAGISCLLKHWWLKTPWWWHESVETSRSIDYAKRLLWYINFYDTTVHFLVIIKNHFQMFPSYGVQLISYMDCANSQFF